MTAKLANIRAGLSLPRSVFLLLICVQWLMSAQVSAGSITFDELKMHLALRKIPEASAYKVPSDFVKAGSGRLPLELRRKSKNLLSAINKSVTLKTKVKKRTMDSIVRFIEDMKPVFSEHFKENSSLFIHPDNDIPFAIMAYRSGRIYILFEDKDTESKKGGYKTFTRSIEYNSEKPHAHLAIRSKKGSSRRLHSVINELKVLSVFEQNERVLSFLDSDVYVYRNAEGTYDWGVAIEEELYDGDLATMVEECPKLSDAVEVFIGMAKALHEVHEGGYVHRDIKPDNFLFRTRKGTTEIILADFGLAQRKDSLDFGTYMCGTPGFIDPQQCLHSTEPEGLAFETFMEAKQGDVFSLGMAYMDVLHGSSHSLHVQVDTVNDLIFDSKKLKSDANSLREAIDLFKTLHQSTFTVGSSDLKADGKILFELHEIIADMIHPDPTKRPALSEIINSLQRMKPTASRNPFRWLFNRSKRVLEK